MLKWHFLEKVEFFTGKMYREGTSFAGDEMSTAYVWGNWWGMVICYGENVRGNIRGTCPDPCAGLQVSMCSIYDLGHPGKHTQTHRQSDSF